VSVYLLGDLLVRALDDASYEGVDCVLTLEVHQRPTSLSSVHGSVVRKPRTATILSISVVDHLIVSQHKSSVHCFLVLDFIPGSSNSLRKDGNEVSLLHVGPVLKLCVKEHVKLSFRDVVFQVEALKTAVLEVFTSARLGTSGEDAEH